MHWQQLPKPVAGGVPAFAEPAGAQAWLATIAALPPLAALAALGTQVDAVDAAGWPAPASVQSLNVLRAAAVPLHALAEGDYARKPLPPDDATAKAFGTAERFWRHLAIAYLRTVPLCTPANRCLPLHRAAGALRIAQHAAFVAGQDVNPQVDALFVAVLALAAVNGVLDRGLADPDFPSEGQGTVAGQVAWALLMRQLDPYRLTLVQLPFVSRLLRRWRELAKLQSEPGTVRRGYLLDLAEVLDSAIPDDVPRYLNLRSIAHKAAGRVAKLEAGESPESLNLGRALSSGAALALLKDMERQLQRRRTAPSGEAREVELVFGTEAAYAAFKDRLLNAGGGEGASPEFDVYRRPLLPTVSDNVRTSSAPLKVPGEHWRLAADGAVTRAAGGRPVSSPALAAAKFGEAARLGILGGLHCGADGTLAGELTWLEGEAEAGCLRQLLPRGDRQVRVPAFVVRAGDRLSLLLPPEAGARLGVRQDLAGMSVPAVTPVEVIARGSDFVLFACTR